ncbi:glycine oxidase ThiO [Paenibacillus sp. TRM 82003]|uniref:glycine oxidase ThiO n=1 Tax=Kineococcus sp. TRM81007 TaxID=2925831 RepID=UPI001F5A0D2D|nr:glycine oxidase ThiO [Kineococcus sp. TRM81007]MCI2237575.1 glycine oxidase ThiO [Kineococcus sp. TRM81007]MCI3921853.1 glycine oxidase ThiO [Paenibacillus sp. TRM 82003]
MRACDVVVLGGGIVGTACAWRLAERGRRVVLADPDPGGGASRAAAGMLAPVSELHHGERELLDLSLLAAAGFRRYAVEAGAAGNAPTGYRHCGTLAVALDAGDRARLADVRRAQELLGLDVQALTGRECRRLEPFLDPAVSGGTLVHGDHQVDPRALLAALRAAAAARGVRVVPQRGEVLVEDGRAVGVRFADGPPVRAPLVVLATGARAQGHAPVRPVKGQVARLRMPAGQHLLQRTVRGVVRDRDVYLVPREDGELVVGATTEDRGFDETVTAGAVHDLLRDAQALVPGTAELELVEVLARSRPGSPDNLPLIGHGDVPGLLLAVGHHRNGVLLSGVTAEAVAALADGEPVPPEVAACDPGRFGSRTAAREEVGAL